MSAAEPVPELADARPEDLPDDELRARIRDGEARAAEVRKQATEAAATLENTNALRIAAIRERDEADTDASILKAARAAEQAGLLAEVRRRRWATADAVAREAEEAVSPLRLESARREARVRRREAEDDVNRAGEALRRTLTHFAVSLVAFDKAALTAKRTSEATAPLLGEGRRFGSAPLAVRILADEIRLALGDAVDELVRVPLPKTEAGAVKLRGLAEETTP
jgi:hypothetical protein